MQLRSLGPGAPDVSAVGYGGMHLSIDGRPDEEQGVRVVHAALDAGVTLIDTADAYCLGDHDTGHNERLIARALRKWHGPRETVLVATKGGLTRPGGRWEHNGRPEYLRRACEASLGALGVAEIALYQLHAPDPAVPFEESVGALARLLEDGKILRVGLSNVSVEEIERARSIVPITSVQNRLNPFFREALSDGVIEYCTKEKLGFLAYSPVGGGRLNRKLPGHPVVAEVARRAGASAHAVVIAWVLCKGRQVVPIPSSRTVEHVVDAAGAAAVELDIEAIHAIDSAAFPTT